MAKTDDDTGGFAELRPLILAEWPKVAEDALDETEGDHAKIVELVVASGDFEGELVERQLAELAELAREDGKAADGGDRPVQEVARSLQTKMNEVASYVRGQMLADARGKARENFLVTLLLAIGLGFVLGIIVRGFGRGRS
jgi:hypothetical protein